MGTGVYCGTTTISTRSDTGSPDGSRHPAHIDGTTSSRPSWPRTFSTVTDTPTYLARCSTWAPLRPTRPTPPSTPVHPDHRTRVESGGECRRGRTTAGVTPSTGERHTSARTSVSYPGRFHAGTSGDNGRRNASTEHRLLWRSDSSRGGVGTTSAQPQTDKGSVRVGGS